MNKTQNYQLNQWERTDKVLMKDFNADNVKIDGAIAKVAAAAEAIPKIAAGSYVGSGQSGPAAPNILTFPFPPRIVIVVEESGLSQQSCLVLLQGQQVSAGTSNYNSNYGARLRLTWSGNTLSWYTESPNETLTYQMSRSGVTYRYLAIG